MLITSFEPSCWFWDIPGIYFPALELCDYFSLAGVLSTYLLLAGAFLSFSCQPKCRLQPNAAFLEITFLITSLNWFYTSLPSHYCFFSYQQHNCLKCFCLLACLLLLPFPLKQTGCPAHIYWMSWEILEGEL